MTGGYFTRTYEVWRKTTTTGPYGSPVEEWAKLSDIPGRAYKKTIRAGFDAAQFYGELDWTFACPADTDLKTADEVRFDGRRLEVRATSVTSRGDRIEALCKELQ